MISVECCIAGCKQNGFLKADTMPIDWNSHWYCLHHRGNSPFTTKLQDPPHQMPKPIVNQQPSATLPATPELKEAFGIEEDPVLTIQQEADLDQAAYEWVQEMKLIVNAIQGPNEQKIGDIVANAMKAACLEQIKEIKRLRTEVAETAEHLGKVTDQAVLISNHLTMQTQRADEAAKALDLLSRQVCECPASIEPHELRDHTEGCSMKIAEDALVAMKTIMENAGGE